MREKAEDFGHGESGKEVKELWECKRPVGTAVHMELGNLPMSCWKKGRGADVLGRRVLGCCC